MFIKKLMKIALATVAVLGCTSITRSQTIITFDDLDPSSLPNGATPYEAPIPNGYNGLQWDNLWVLDVPQSGIIGEGYDNGLVSGDNEAFNSFGNSASISITDGSFNLNSAYLTAALGDGTLVEVQGFVGTTLTYDNTYTVNTEAPTLETFNYAGVDEVNFISTIPAFGGANIEFAMDNLVVTVPEPGTIGLLIFGASLVGLAGLKKKCEWKARRL
jgi:hypothetical protein